MKPIKLMLPGFLIVAATYGFARYTYGPFLAMIQNDFNLDHQMTGFIGGLPYFGYIIGTILAIWCVKRIGLKKPIIIGGMLATIGLFLVMSSFSLWLLMAGIIIGGSSGGFVWTAMPIAVTRLIDSSKQSVVIAFVNAGPALAIFLTGPLAFTFGSEWRLIWGVFSILALITLVWTYKVLPSDQLTIDRNALKGYVKKKTLLNQGKVFFAASVICGIGTGVYVTYAVNLIYDMPLSISVLSQYPQFFMSFLGLISLASVLTGLALKKVPFQTFYLLTTSTLAFSVLLLPLAFHWSILVLSAIMFGLTFFTYFALLVLWGLRRFKEQASEANGIMLLLISLGQFLAPIFTGYFLSFVSLSTIFVASGLLLATLLVLKPVAESTRKTSAMPKEHIPAHQGLND
ncbi:MFS transporter [Salicibibacter cibarius]|uniref:MFS transporter n=1 Tax=Salicibibacter cibarius TaxID=2743000 RepID=A0A7T6Z3P8_9BACI|nr:MFS transporter [Salicibibacter cibarius]QQK76206.1 MFS transporter [Salicibibacter cibarius]